MKEKTFLSLLSQLDLEPIQNKIKKKKQKKGKTRVTLVHFSFSQTVVSRTKDSNIQIRVIFVRFNKPM